MAGLFADDPEAIPFLVQTANDEDGNAGAVAGVEITSSDLGDHHSYDALAAFAREMEDLASRGEDVESATAAKRIEGVARFHADYSACVNALASNPTAVFPYWPTWVYEECEASRIFGFDLIGAPEGVDLCPPTAGSTDAGAARDFLVDYVVKEVTSQDVIDFFQGLMGGLVASMTSGAISATDYGYGCWRCLGWRCETGVPDVFVLASWSRFFFLFESLFRCAS